MSPYPGNHNTRVIDGAAGGRSLVAGLNGGTGESITGICPSMLPERAKAYALRELAKGPVYSDRAEVDLRYGCGLLVSEGCHEVVADHRYGVTTWDFKSNAEPITTDVVNRAGLMPGERRQDQLRRICRTQDHKGMDDFIHEDDGEFSEDGL